MHRNTIILIVILAILSAVVAGVNLGRRTLDMTESPTPSSTPSPTPDSQTYHDEKCGVQFVYGLSYTRIDNPHGGVVLSDTSRQKRAIAVSCEAKILRPSLPKNNQNTINIGSLEATIYKDIESSTNTEIHKLFVRHPIRNIDIFIAGSDGALEEILPSLTIID